MCGGALALVDSRSVTRREPDRDRCTGAALRRSVEAPQMSRSHTSPTDYTLPFTNCRGPRRAPSKSAAKGCIAQAAQALEQFQAQQEKLGQRSKGAGRRASAVIQAANDEIVAIHTDLARTVSAGLGLRSARS